MLSKRYAHFRRDLGHPDLRKLSKKIFLESSKKYLRKFFLGFAENS